MCLLYSPCLALLNSVLFNLVYSHLVYNASTLTCFSSIRIKSQILSVPPGDVDK